MLYLNSITTTLYLLLYIEGGVLGLIFSNEALFSVKQVSLHSRWVDKDTLAKQWKGRQVMTQTRLFDVPLGKFDQFKRLLADAGLTGEMLEETLRKPELAEVMVKSLREQLAPPLPQLFRSPEEMLDKLEARAKERNWPLTKTQLEKLRESIPATPEESLVGLSFKLWLGDFEYTIKELVVWIKDEAPGFWQWSDLQLGESHLRLLDSDHYGDEPSVEWVTIDFGANWDKENGIRPVDVRDPKVSPDVDLLVAFAVHPYAANIDYERVPSCWVPGFEVSVDGNEPWRLVPVLYFGRGHRKVEFDANHRGLRHWYCSVPVRRELKELGL